MRKFIWVLSISWILAIVLLAGCSGEPSAGRNDPRAVAEPVPAVAAQALTLRFGLGSEVSLQDVGNQDAASLLVEDVDGFPLVYLTVLGPEAHGGFWEAARAAVDTGEGHYLVATGASTLYSTTLFADTGTDTLEHLVAAADALGGPDAVARVVGFGDPGRYYLVDREGRFFDGYTGEAVSEEDLAKLNEGFHDTVDRLAGDDDYQAEMAHVWACLLGEANEDECSAEDASAEALQARQAEAELLSSMGYDPVSVQSAEAQPQASGLDLAAMTGPDGELDFVKAARVIERGGAGNYTNHEDMEPLWGKKYCLGWFCFGEYWVLEARQGKTEAQRNANPVDKDHEWHTVGQNWQDWTSYGYRWKDYYSPGHSTAGYPRNDRFPQKFNDSDYANFTYRGAFPTNSSTVYGGLPTGCGPAAFIRLAAWFQFERNQYNGESNINWYGGSTPNLYYEPITSQWYMYRKNSWLGGRMLSFHKQAYGGKYIYIPDLINKMGTGEAYTQGLTLPGGFFNGANAWLAERGSNLRLHGGGYVFTLQFIPIIGHIAWNIEVWKMYREAMGSLGLRNEPGIALHPWGDGQYHYSPTLEARLYNWRTSATVLVRVNWTEGSPLSGKFVNISYYGHIAGGYYALR